MPAAFKLRPLPSMFEGNVQTQIEMLQAPCARGLPVAFRVFFHEHESRRNLPRVRNLCYSFVLTDDRGTTMANILPHYCLRERLITIKNNIIVYTIPI